MAINSVDRALDIILLFYEEEREMGVSEIAERMDEHKSTIHRTLIALEEKGFVKQNSDNEKYWLGMKLYAIGMKIKNKMPLRNIMKPFCDSLSKEFGEVVNASVLSSDNAEYDQSMIIYKAFPPNNLLTVNPPEGAISPCYGSAVGKCLLAFGDVDLNKYKNIKIKKYTNKTISDWQELTEKIEQIRREGYAIDDEELEMSLTCIGAPILDSSGKAIAAISLSGPSQRMKSKDFEYKIKRVKEVAKEITLQFK